MYPMHPDLLCSVNGWIYNYLIVFKIKSTIQTAKRRGYLNSIIFLLLCFVIKAIFLMLVIRGKQSILLSVQFHSRKTK